MCQWIPPKVPEVPKVLKVPKVSIPHTHRVARSANCMMSGAANTAAKSSTQREVHSFTKMCIANAGRRMMKYAFGAGAVATGPIRAMPSVTKMDTLFATKLNKWIMDNQVRLDIKSLLLCMSRCDHAMSSSHTRCHVNKRILGPSVFAHVAQRTAAHAVVNDIRSPRVDPIDSSGHVHRAAVVTWIGDNRSEC